MDEKKVKMLAEMYRGVVFFVKGRYQMIYTPVIPKSFSVGS